jgi:hypothetical protein
MQLLVQVVGALAAGLLVWALARSGGLRGRPAAATVAVLAVVAGALISAPNLRNAIAGFAEQRHANEALSAEQKRVQAGAILEPNEGFLAWTKERIAPTEDFQLVTESSLQSQLASQWVLYQLEPRVGVVKGVPGDWFVFYDVPPASYEAPEFGDLQVYEPRYAIARYERGT